MSADVRNFLLAAAFVRAHLRKRVLASLRRYPCRPSVASNNLRRLAKTEGMDYLSYFLIARFRHRRFYGTANELLGQF